MKLTIFMIRSNSAHTEIIIKGRNLLCVKGVRMLRRTLNDECSHLASVCKALINNAYVAHLLHLFDICF